LTPQQKSILKSCYSTDPGEDMNSGSKRSISRRDFVKEIATVGTATAASIVIPEMAFAAPSSGSSEKSVTVFRLSSRGTRSCNACRTHHKYNIFISYSHANRNRAHPGCNCPIVKQKLPKEVFRRVFLETDAIRQGFIDLRTLRRVE